MTSTNKTRQPINKRVLSILFVLLSCFFSAVFAYAATSSIPAVTLKTVTITDSASKNTPPDAVIKYTQKGDVYTFDASGSNDSDGIIAGYKWDFGDGATGSGVKISHTFALNDTFHVTLTVIDNRGGVALIQNLISTIPVILAEQTIGDADTTNIIKTRSEGQGIFLSKAATLRTIIIKTGGTQYGSLPARIRIGTSKNLSASYIAESKEVTLDAKNKEYSFVFPSSVQLKADTQYYFAISITNDLSSNYINFKSSSSNSYAPAGCSDCNRFYNSTKKWNIAGLSYSNDLYFKIIQ